MFNFHSFLIHIKLEVLLVYLHSALFMFSMLRTVEVEYVKIIIA